MKTFSIARQRYLWAPLQRQPTTHTWRAEESDGSRRSFPNSWCEIWHLLECATSPLGGKTQISANDAAPGAAAAAASASRQNRKEVVKKRDGCQQVVVPTWPPTGVFVLSCCCVMRNNANAAGDDGAQRGSLNSAKACRSCRSLAIQTDTPQSRAAVVGKIQTGQWWAKTAH